MMKMVMRVMDVVDFNGSVEPTQPGMILGLGWRSGQGDVIPESCCSREKGMHMSIYSGESEGVM